MQILKLYSTTHIMLLNRVRSMQCLSCDDGIPGNITRTNQGYFCEKNPLCKTAREFQQLDNYLIEKDRNYWGSGELGIVPLN
jgi:hypothetical protein